MIVPAFLTKRFGKDAGVIMLVLGFVISLGLILLLAYCQGRDDGRSGEVIEQQKREIEVQQDLGEAAAASAEARVRDAVRAEQQKKELQDALEATSDPDRQRALRGCVILRQQGRDTSGIPACSGSASRL